MPAILNSTLAINPAFLREIKEDHRDLRDAFASVAAQLANLSRTSSWRHVVSLLHTLRDRVAMHFALEEAYGYCDDAISTAPWLSERAERLRSEHGDLFVQVNNLVEMAERILYHEAGSERILTLVNSFTRFELAFEEHEQQEGEMIQDAYADEFGGGD